MTKRLDLPQTLLVIAAFLIPLLGGQISMDADTLPNGVLGGLASVFGGSAAPTLAHTLLAFLIGSAFIALLLTRRVVQVPNNTLAVTLCIFGGGVAASVIVSDFRSVSTPIGLEWVTYVLAFFAVVGAAGRRNGPIAIVSAFVAGTTLLAALGLREYMDSSDPNWRIFSLWVGPNALATMLLVGFVLSLGLLLILDRLGKTLAALAVCLIGAALVLTQSKGGLAVVPIGIVGVFAAALLKREGGNPKSLLRVPLALVGVVVLTLLIQRLPTLRGAQAGSLGRITNAAATSEQSAGFRKLLWKTSIELIKNDPVGSGVGTFRFNSARPGIVTSTQLAHNAFLQLGSEASLVVVGILAVALILWLRLVFRGVKTLPWDSRVLLGAIVSAVVVVLAHCVVDSDLYYFGVGISTFMLMGLALLLSSDSVAPEFLFKSIRQAGVVATLIPLLGLGYFSYTEILRAEARAGLAAGDRNLVIPPLETLHSIAPADGEAWYITALSAPEIKGQIEAAQKAVEFSPSTRNLRLLARLYLTNNQMAEAMSNIQRALRQDPRGLSTLKLLAETRRKQGDEEEYEKTLHQIVAVEKTTYFTVRSLPELIPTETYEARINLAEVVKTREERRRLLAEAVAGFKSYLLTTVPQVVKMVKGGEPGFGGEDMSKVNQKMTMAADAAQRLADLDKSLGDPAAASRAEEDAAAFLGALK